MPVALDFRNTIERRFDGPIPAEDLLRGEWGLEQADPLAHAQALRFMWACEVRRQIRRIREMRRVKGTTAHVDALIHELQALRLHFRGANRAFWICRRSS